MQASLQPPFPHNLVSNIVGNKIYLEHIPNQTIDAIRKLGAFQMEYRKNELIWLIKCADEEELVNKLRELNRLGFLFAGDVAGYPAADVFELLLKKKQLSDHFREVIWHGPGDWRIINR